jgi:hypothetical protein
MRVDEDEQFVQLHQVDVGSIDTDLNLELVSTDLAQDVGLVLLRVHRQETAADLVDGRSALRCG